MSNRRFNPTYDESVTEEHIPSTSNRSRSRNAVGRSKSTDNSSLNFNNLPAPVARELKAASVTKKVVERFLRNDPDATVDALLEDNLEVRNQLKSISLTLDGLLTVKKRISNGDFRSSKGFPTSMSRGNSTIPQQRDVYEDLRVTGREEKSAEAEYHHLKKLLAKVEDPARESRLRERIADLKQEQKEKEAEFRALQVLVQKTGKVINDRSGPSAGGATLGRGPAARAAAAARSTDESLDSRLYKEVQALALDATSWRQKVRKEQQRTEELEVKHSKLDDTLHQLRERLAEAKERVNSMADGQMNEGDFDYLVAAPRDQKVHLHNTLSEADLQSATMRSSMTLRRDTSQGPTGRRYRDVAPRAVPKTVVQSVKVDSLVTVHSMEKKLEVAHHAVRRVNEDLRRADEQHRKLVHESETAFEELQEAIQREATRHAELEAEYRRLQELAAKLPPVEKKPGWDKSTKSGASGKKSAAPVELPPVHRAKNTSSTASSNRLPSIQRKPLVPPSGSRLPVPPTQGRAGPASRPLKESVKKIEQRPLPEEDFSLEQQQEQQENIEEIAAEEETVEVTPVAAPLLDEDEVRPPSDFEEEEKSPKRKVVKKVKKVAKPLLEAPPAELYPALPSLPSGVVIEDGKLSEPEDSPKKKSPKKSPKKVKKTSPKQSSPMPEQHAEFQEDAPALQPVGTPVGTPPRVPTDAELFGAPTPKSAKFTTQSKTPRRVGGIPDASSSEDEATPSRGLKNIMATPGRRAGDSDEEAFESNDVDLREELERRQQEQEQEFFEDEEEASPAPRGQGGNDFTPVPLKSSGKRSVFDYQSDEEEEQFEATRQQEDPFASEGSRRASEKEDEEEEEFEDDFEDDFEQEEFEDDSPF